MSVEQFPKKELSSEEFEHERLLHCFSEGICPHCGGAVSDVHTNDHLGFCNEGHLHTYQVDHSTDVRLDYTRTHNLHLHTQYLENLAEELNIPIELAETLHDTEHLSPAEMRASIEEYKKRKAA